MVSENFQLLRKLGCLEAAAAGNRRAISVKRIYRMRDKIEIATTLQILKSKSDLLKASSWMITRATIDGFVSTFVR